MNTAAHLVIVIGENVRPALESLLHWQRQPEGLRRLVLYHPDDPASSREPARRLERFVREQFPDLDLLRREGGPDPRHLRRQLEAWIRDTPEEPWIVDLTGASPLLSWGVETWLGRPLLRVIRHHRDLQWLEYRRSPEGDAEGVPLPEPRRDALDSVPLARLLNLLRSETTSPADPQLVPCPEPPANRVALTEAAIQADWQWAHAYRACSVPFPDQASDNDLFARYLAGLVTSLGVASPQLARPDDHPNTPPSSPHPEELWFQHGGRVVVLDLDLAEAAPPDPNSPSKLQQRLQRAARLGRSLPGASLEWVLVRPALRLAPLECALVESLRVTCLDQSACHDLPSRIAALFGRPLSTEGIEIERLLAAHLLRTAHTRAFCPEPATLRSDSPASDDVDPLWARADRWADQVMAERGQNWLLSVHRGKSFLRVPAEGRPNADQEWRLLVLHTSGLRESEVGARHDRRTASVLAEFPATTEANRRVAAWMRPFLNRHVSFAEAQTRFAVQARVEAEAAHAAGVATRPAPAPVPAPKPAPRPSQPRTPGPSGPARGRPAPPPPPPPPRTSLADLDRALDDALGG